MTESSGRLDPLQSCNHYPFISVGKYPRTAKKIRSIFTEERAGVAGNGEEAELLFVISANASASKSICLGISYVLLSSE